MPVYEFVTIENEDVMEIPGEIVKVCDNSPHTQERFTCLIRIDNEVVTDVPDEKIEEHSEEEYDFTEVDRVGDKVALRLKAQGYSTPSQINEAGPDKVANEVKGLGPSTAERIVQHYSEEE